MKFILEFEKGDKVRSTGNILGMNSEHIPPNVEMTILDTDPEEPNWYYYALYGVDQQTWIPYNSPLEPIIKLPKPPKFKTQAEADAWLEKHR